MNNDGNKPTDKEDDQSIMGQPEQPSPLRMSCITSKLAQDAETKNPAFQLFTDDFFYQLLVEANVYFELEMIDECSKRLEVYLKQFPHYAKGQNMIGLCHWLSDRLGPAMAALEKACSIEPENSEYQADLIHLYYCEDMDQQTLERTRLFFNNNPKLRFDLYTALRAYGIEHKFIQLAWKTRKQNKLKVLNGDPFKNGFPMKE